MIMRIQSTRKADYTSYFPSYTSFFPLWWRYHTILVYTGNHSLKYAQNMIIELWLKELLIWSDRTRCSTSLCRDYWNSKLPFIKKSKSKEYFRMAHSSSCFRWVKSGNLKTLFRFLDRILLMIFAATFLFGSFYFYSEIGRHPVPDHPFQETYKTFAKISYAAFYLWPISALMNGWNKPSGHDEQNHFRFIRR